MDDKDIRFTSKKVDESWKEQAARDKDSRAAAATGANTNTHGAGTSAPSPASESKRPQTSPAFLNLLKSLGYQAMIHLGEIPHPGTGQRETDIEAARETIDLLLALKAKTGAGASAEEAELFEGILPELQLKFAGKT